MITRRVFLGAAVGVAGLGLIATTASSVKSGYFPNCALRTHEGKLVRFYDDLIKGKVVAINMMYAKCDGICPRMTTNLLDVQAELGDRLGREVFMYSITLKPTEDTPDELRRYVNRHVVAPRWPFLTGDPDDIELIRRRLGFYDSDPAVDGDTKQHTGMVRIGNDALGRWTMTPALAKPAQIAGAILRIRTVV